MKKKLIAININTQPSLEIDGHHFLELDDETLISFIKIASHLFAHVGLRLHRAYTNVSIEPTKQTGEVSKLNGHIAPLLLAANALSALTVSMNGAETGDTKTYLAVKNQMDGMGAVSMHNAFRRLGELLYAKGYYVTTVSTEGTPSHPKPGEPAIGNPTIPIGTTYPSLRDLVKQGHTISYNNGIPIVSGLKPLYAVFDVVEGTELAATTQKTYRDKAGHSKDNGSVTLSGVATDWQYSPDLYMDKIAVSAELSTLLKKANEELNVTDPLAVTLEKISKATGKSVSDLGVMCLGTKERFTGNGVNRTSKLERARHEKPIQELRDAGVSNLYTVDDGDASMMLALVNGTTMNFPNGKSGKIDLMLLSGGVVETMTLARAVRDTGGDAWVALINPEAMKIDYNNRFDFPTEMKSELANKGINTPGVSMNISNLVPDNGDRLLIEGGITANIINPCLKAPQFLANGIIRLTLHAISADGSSISYALDLAPETDMASIEELMSPVLPTLMSLPLDKIDEALENMNSKPKVRGAFINSLPLYLYSLISENLTGNRYKLNEEIISARLNSQDAEDIKALKVIRFLARTHANLFSNPECLNQI